MDAARRASELGVALVLASERNMIIDICRLLSQGADVNYVARKTHAGKEQSTTPLIRAAFKGHADAMRVLISRGTSKSLVIGRQPFIWQLKSVAYL
jgi:ankyrin repeat protein